MKNKGENDCEDRRNQTNYMPADSSVRNFKPSAGGRPPDVDPMKPPPFPIGGPIGEKPKDSGTEPSTEAGKGGKGK